MKCRLICLLFAASISMSLVACGTVDDTLTPSEADVLVNDGTAAAEGQSSTPDAEATPPIGDADATSQPPLADGDREDVKAGEEPPEDAGDKAPPGADEPSKDTKDDHDGTGVDDVKDDGWGPTADVEEEEDVFIPAHICGDGLPVSGLEACDHGELNGTYGHCQSDCSGLGERCGDGVIQAEHEVCDDGPLNGTLDACRADCAGQTLGIIIDDYAKGFDPNGGQLCESDDLLKKYARYRLRYWGNGTQKYGGFIVEGEGPGKSMPAAHRRPNVNCSSYWSYANTPCVPEDLPDAHGMMHWGDGTVWLGNHLSMLALEHRVQSLKGISTDATERRIYEALMAFNRLDAKAETYYGLEGEVDGFFIRDDVPADFMLRDDGTYRFPRGGEGLSGYECISAQLNCEDDADILTGDFASQDQVINLIPGLALIAKLVPSNTTYSGVNLVFEAKSQLHRMTMHARDNSWKLVDPEGEHGGASWGGKVSLRYAVARAANAVIGGALGMSDYRNWKSDNIAASINWTGLWTTWPVMQYFSRTMGLALGATMTNGYEVPIVDLPWSDPVLFSDFAIGDNKEVYALLHLILNDLPAPSSLSNWWIESWLYTAPCSGPCRGTSGCEEVPGWQTESRSMTPQDGLGSQHHEEFEGNGLDFMTLMLAYIVHRDGQFPPAVIEADPACASGQGKIGVFTASETPPSGVWSISDKCASHDLNRTFCGRPFSSWLNDAHGGDVTIFTNGSRWTCSSVGMCSVDPDPDPVTAGDDLIIGSVFADTLHGGKGNDCIVGLDGDDTLTGGKGYDWIEGGEGNDSIDGDPSSLIESELFSPDVIYGGPGDDTLIGGGGADVLVGGEGDDFLNGNSGDDLLDGGPGHDSLRGGLGRDGMRGGEGDDALKGNGGEDQLWGEDGRDKLDGRDGNDFLSGGAGQDFLRGDGGDDKLKGGGELDHLCGNGGDDELWGGWNFDRCLGGSGWFPGDDEVKQCDNDNPLDANDCDTDAYHAW